MPSYGGFCWYELLTPDLRASLAFYGEVAAWKSEPFKAGAESGYQILISSQGPIGGVMSRSEAARTAPDPASIANLPPHWMAHVLVENVDAACAAARKLEGAVRFGPEEVPDVGRFAVIADPHGASLAVFAPSPGSKPLPPHDENQPGEFCWHELLTKDKASAFRFYSRLFGWKKRNEIPMGLMGTYLIFGTDGKDVGGMFSLPQDAPTPPTWLYYVHTDDLGAAIARVEGNGGTVLSGPMEVPDGSRVAQVADPQGALFALLEPK